MLGKKQVNMLEGSITKALLVIAIPVMVMNLLQSLFDVIDMTMLKMFDTDGLSVGAAGASTPLRGLINALVVGVATGGNVVIARYLGKKDPENVDRAIGTAVAFSFLGGLLLTVIGLLGANPLLKLINCSEVLFSRARLYFRMYYIGAPILIFYNFCAAILRAAGDSRKVMYISLTGGVVKVLANYVFVAVFRLGVLGVSLATITSWCVYAGLSLWCLTRKDSPVQIKVRHIRIIKEELMKMLRIGIPTGLQTGFFYIANVLIVATVNSFGEKATTGVSIANTFDGIMSAICGATALAVMPYVSQNLGAKNPKRACRSVGRGILITICIGAVLGAASALLSRQLSSIMTDDPEVIAWSRQKMVIISSTYFIYGINQIMSATMWSMGKPLAPTITTLIFLCALRFAWVYFVFPLIPNLTFLYLVWPIGWALSAFTLWLVYIPTAKKLKSTASIA
ncbi:MAG: MATE family efflux transporter [Oscillospiraceae bacterium]|nr:MATE family efflux transporter [Oscillospiraceae bacterium]